MQKLKLLSTQVWGPESRYKYFFPNCRNGDQMGTLAPYPYLTYCQPHPYTRLYLAKTQVNGLLLIIFGRMMNDVVHVKKRDTVTSLKFSIEL